MQSHALKLHKAVLSGKYTFCISTRSTESENSIALKKGPRGHDNCVHVFCFALQFSASTEGEETLPTSNKEKETHWHKEERKGKGYTAVRAYVGSLAEAETVPVTRPVRAREQEHNI
eukprot:1148500-Pelagomonas_calceolata.AAC.1